jgi:hypothetical protein
LASALKSETLILISNSTKYPALVIAQMSHSHQFLGVKFGIANRHVDPNLFQIANCIADSFMSKKENPSHQPGVNHSSERRARVLVEGKVSYRLIYFEAGFTPVLLMV